MGTILKAAGLTAFLTAAVFVLMHLIGCGNTESAQVVPTAPPLKAWHDLTGSIEKFQDGEITCYVYTVRNGGGISCIRTAFVGRVYK